MPKYAARVDDNQRAIVNGLRKIGATVEHMAKLGKGAPDLVVGFKGVNYLFEIANPETRHGRSKRAGSKEAALRESGTIAAQIAWHLSWRGRVDVIETLEQAVEIVTGRGKPIAVVHF